MTLVLQGLPMDSLLPKFVLEVDSIHDVPPSRGKQVVPNFRRPGGALGEAFGKERALLQVLCIHDLICVVSIWLVSCVVHPCGDQVGVMSRAVIQSGLLAMEQEFAPAPAIILSLALVYMRRNAKLTAITCCASKARKTVGKQK